ncbi:MAG: hypothetical protein ACK5MP_02740 [Nostocoides sp.]
MVCQERHVLEPDQDYDGNDTIETGEVYSNQGYLYAVASSSPYPASQGPGIFDLQHWVNSNTSLGFRLPYATEHTLHDVTVTIDAASSNLALNGGLTTLGYDSYLRFDGDPAYTTAAPAPTVSFDAGVYTLHWDTIPAGSANILSFGGTALDGAALTPTNHYLIEAELTATYAEGDGCAPTEPTLPAQPAVGSCQQLWTGRTLMPVPATDITAREKWGADGEVNADGWGSGSTRTFRLYGASDVALTDVTFTATAAQGFTFDPATVGTVITGSPIGMGQLYANGYTAPVDGIGAVTVSPDGRNLSLTIATMPAHSAFAVTIVGALDGSWKQLVIDETMVGSIPGCMAGRTHTVGWYANHADGWPSDHSPAATYYLSGQSWQDVLSEPIKGRIYYQLARQYIAATLNVSSGASATSDVTEALQAAQAFFETSTAKGHLTPAQTSQLKALIPILDDFNNGLSGASHCPA